MNDDHFDPLPMFKDAIRKVHWGVAKIRMLEAVADDYSNNRIHVTLHDPQPDDDFRLVEYQAQPFPDTVPLDVGDIIRNLRGALDYQISAIYRYHGLPENNAYFLFGDTRQELDNHFRNRFGKYGLEYLRSTLVDVVKATKEENSLLWALNKIDRANKHRELAVVVRIALAPMPSYTLNSQQGHALVYGNSIELDPGEAHISRIPRSAQLMPSADAKPQLQFVFDYTEVFPGEHVLPLLLNIGALVLQTMRAVQAEFVRNNPEVLSMQAS